MNSSNHRLVGNCPYCRALVRVHEDREYCPACGKQIYPRLVVKQAPRDEGGYGLNISVSFESNEANDDDPTESDS